VSEIQRTDSAATVKIVYVLYLVGLLTAITAIVGVVMAYVNRADAPQWIADHFTYQIRTFWIGMVYSLTGTLLTGIGIGYLILLLFAIWLIVRCVKGLQWIQGGVAPPDVETWYV